MAFSFSYSRWSLWSKCPAAFKYKNVDKLPEPDSEALIKGRKVHDEIAKYVAGAADDMPSSLSRFTTLATDLRAMPQDRVHVEHQVALDKTLRLVKWFGKTAWFRAAYDVLVDTSEERADAVDWKTGKPYGSYDDQKELFALPLFWTRPKLETFGGHWTYLDTGDVHEATFTRDQALSKGGLSDKWMENAARMEADTAFTPTPSDDACRFCNFSWRKKGPCREGV